MGLDRKHGDHELCIIDEIVKLMNRNFVCYLEYFYGDGNRIVDILGIRKEERVMIEVGTLSQKNRIARLKELFPKTKIIWVQQWKNYGITDSSMEQFAIRKFMKSKVDMHKIAEILD